MIGASVRLAFLQYISLYCRVHVMFCCSSFNTNLSPLFLSFSHVQSWVHLLALWDVCFATLAIYPAIQVKIASTGTSPEFLRGPFWVSITTFLLFASCSMLGTLLEINSMIRSRVSSSNRIPNSELRHSIPYGSIGNLLATLFPWPSPRWYWPLCHVRTALALPFFLMCNALPDTRVLPVWFYNDWFFIVGQILFAYTNGHLASLAVMYNPRYVSYYYSLYIYLYIHKMHRYSCRISNKLCFPMAVLLSAGLWPTDTSRSRECSGRCPSRADCSWVHSPPSCSFSSSRIWEVAKEHVSELHSNDSVLTELFVSSDI